MDENDTEDLFVERCVNAALLSRPNWRLDSAKMVVVMEIRKRARAAFAKYHPSVGDVVESGSKTTFSGETKDPSHANDNNENNHDEEEDEGDDEDGEVNEDGEMDDDDQEDDGQADEEAGTKTNSAQKSVDMGPKKKGTKNKKKKVIVRKKSTNPKPTIQPRKAVLSNRGRRVGRGGSNAGSSKSG